MRLLNAGHSQRPRDYSPTDSVHSPTRSTPYYYYNYYNYNNYNNSHHRLR